VQLSGLNPRRVADNWLRTQALTARKQGAR